MLPTPVKALKPIGRIGVILHGRAAIDHVVECDPAKQAVLCIRRRHAVAADGLVVSRACRVKSRRLRSPPSPLSRPVEEKGSRPGALLLIQSSYSYPCLSLRLDGLLTPQLCLPQSRCTGSEGDNYGYVQTNQYPIPILSLEAIWHSILAMGLL